MKHGTTAVGLNLATERKKCKLSQEELAAKLHVTRQTISNWESGKSQPDIEMLKQLSVSLSVPVETLIYGKDKPKGAKARIQNEIGGFCFHLSIATYTIGMILGLKSGSGAYSPAPNSIAYAFFLSDALPVWAAALMFGTILLGISEIIRMLEEKASIE
ncbi:MAG: helix-turn-helix domain-containing protein [Lawsonibacter sp.]